MDADVLTTGYRIELPAWVADEVAEVPDVLPSLEDRMRLVHRLAGRNFLEGGGGPFAAIVVERDSGRVVSVGVNVVLGCGISSGHAEVTALGLAQARLGSWDQFRARGIEVTTDVLRRGAVATWQAYADHVAATGATVDNARAIG